MKCYRSKRRSIPLSVGSKVTNRSSQDLKRCVGDCSVKRGAWFLDQISRGTERGHQGGFEMSPGWRCGSGSAGRWPQVLVQDRDALREQRVHIEGELHGPLCGASPACTTSLPPFLDTPPLGVHIAARWKWPSTPRPSPSPSCPGDPPLLAGPAVP